MIRQVLSSGVWAISFASSSPSVPGIRASSSTSAKGSFDVIPRHSALMAAGMRPDAVGIFDDENGRGDGLRPDAGEADGVVVPGGDLTFR